MMFVATKESSNEPKTLQVSLSRQPKTVPKSAETRNPVLQFSQSIAYPRRDQTSKLQRRGPPKADDPALLSPNIPSGKM